MSYLPKSLQNYGNVEAEDEDTFVEAQTELEGLNKQLEGLEFRRMFSGSHDANDAYLDVVMGSTELLSHFLLLEYLVTFQKL